MFDRTYIVPRPQHVTHTHRVTEQRAPTDESVRLLREMESTAKNEVLDAARLSGNGFECVVQALKMPYTGETVLRALFALNGKRMEARARFVDIDPSSPQEVFDRLREAVAAKIAEAIAPALAPLLTSKRIW